VSTRIKEARLKANMSQEELAKKSGITRQTISALENGTHRNVMTKTLIAIANALGVSLDTIFFEVDDQ